MNQISTYLPLARGSVGSCTMPPTFLAVATVDKSGRAATLPTRTWTYAPMGAEDQLDAADGHRIAHVEEQPGARLQVAKIG